MIKILKTLTALALVFHSLAPPLTRASILTKSSDFSDVAKYGLSFSEALMDKKSGSEAAKKIMGDDLLWDLIGKDFELIGGDPEALSKLKSDVSNIKRVLDGIAEVSTRLGAGENVEALIKSIDVAVGLIGHPVVNNLWAAVKLTHQSQQLVRDTRSALQVETLYGLVNRDRRLIGVMEGDSPPLIPVDSDTVTYFFNRYLITDASTRGLVRAYVETVLGEDWPVLPRGTRLWSALTRSSEETRVEHELRELAEFQKVSRGWIRKLIVDLNMQVSKQWAETRLRQARAEFEVFYREFGALYGSLDKAMEHFLFRAEILREIDQYPGILRELNESLNTYWEEYQEMEPVEVDRKIQVRRDIYKIANRALHYRARSLTVLEFGLRDQFETLNREALRRASNIWNDVERSYAEAAEELASQPADTEYARVHNPDTGSYDYRRVPRQAPEEYAAEFETRLLNLWRPLLDYCRGAIQGAPDAPLDEITRLLAENRPKEAREELDKWWDGLSENVELENFSEYGFNIGRAVILGRAMGQIVESIRNNRPYMIETPTIKERLESLEERLSNVSSQSLRDNIEEEIREINEKYSREPIPLNYRRWRIAREQTSDAINIIFQVRDFYSGRARGLDMISFYEIMREEVDREVREYFDELGPIRDTLRSGVAAANNYDRVEDFLRRHPYGPHGKSDHTPQSVTDIRISSHWPHSTSTTPPELFDFSGWSLAIERAEKRFKDLSIDEETLRMYEEFEFPRPVRVRERIDEIENLLREVNPGRLSRRHSQLRRDIDTWRSNRSNALAHIQSLIRQWDEWLEEQKDLGNIKSDGIASPRGYTEYFAFEFELDTRTQTDERGGVGRRVINSEYAVLADPEHNRISYYALADQLRNSPRAAQARASLEYLPAAAFLRNHQPGAWRLLNSQLNLEHFKPAPEANFIYVYGVVWESSLVKARQLIDNLTPESDGFEDTVREIGRILPGFLDPDGTIGRISHIRYHIGNIDMGKRFVAMMEDLTKLRFDRHHYLFNKQQEERERDSAARRLEQKTEILRDMNEELERLRSRYNTLNRSDRISRIEINNLRSDVIDLVPKLNRQLQSIGAQAGPQSKAFSGRVSDLAGEVVELFTRFRVTVSQVEHFYQLFTGSYRRRDVRGILRLLADNWTGGDGADILDVEEYLNNSFRVFDTLDYRISNLRAEQIGDNMRVRYDVNIIGENRRQRLKHEENMTIIEELGIINGEVRILRTLSGRQWLQ